MRERTRRNTILSAVLAPCASVPPALLLVGPGRLTAPLGATVGGLTRIIGGQIFVGVTFGMSGLVDALSDAAHVPCEFLVVVEATDYPTAQAVEDIAARAPVPVHLVHS